MIQVNALGDACPIPVVKTKKAIEQLQGSGVVETLVDNEIAVQNLTKMANQKGYKVSSRKLADRQYQVVMEIGEAGDAEAAPETGVSEPEACMPDARDNTVVVISSATMGEGDPELGRLLMKGYIYALTQLDTLPKTLLFYNGGAALTCEGSASLEDLKSLEAQGVQILTCGTCLNHYGLTDSLKVGEVTNMYVIAETMAGASKLIKP